tara:strand:- start:5 stop:826 length:822 start_codon:yes stop_codon:yes gene_type:complete
VIEYIIGAGTVIAAALAAKLLKGEQAEPVIEIHHKPFPIQWRQFLQEKWPIYRRLPENLRDQLDQLTLVFLERIEIRGIEGLEISDEIRVLTASQACLLLLNQNTFFPSKLKSVIIRPNAYSATQNNTIGGIHSEKEVLVLGQSWENGLVVLSLDNTKTGAANSKDGRNLVLHEFAHQLDQADGLSDGAPILGSREQYAKWKTVCSRVFTDLNIRINDGDKTLIDEYGATNPAEFFSVVTETFFEKPYYLKKKRPELYELFREYYRCNPVTWK